MSQLEGRQQGEGMLKGMLHVASDWFVSDPPPPVPTLQGNPQIDGPAMVSGG